MTQGFYAGQWCSGRSDGVAESFASKLSPSFYTLPLRPILNMNTFEKVITQEQKETPQCHRGQEEQGETGFRPRITRDQSAHGEGEDLRSITGLVLGVERGRSERSGTLESSALRSLVFRDVTRQLGRTPLPNSGWFFSRFTHSVCSLPSGSSPRQNPVRTYWEHSH